MILLGAALLTSLAAQLFFRAGAFYAGLGGTVLAGVLTWVYAHREAGSPFERPAAGSAPAASPFHIRPPHPTLALVAVAVLCLTIALEYRDRYDHWQLFLWVLAVISLNAAYAGPGRCAWRPVQLHAEHALILTLALGAVFLRVYGLERIPGGLYPVEGEFGLRALALLEGVRVRPFDVGFDFHPTLFTYLQAGAMALTGRDIAGLRLVSAVAGGLTVVPWYLFLRRAAGFWAALAGTVLLAVSPWHVHFSRLASNNSLVLLWTVISMSALYRATRSGRAATYVWAGTGLGLCFYFGNKAVMLPPMMLAGLAALAIVERGTVLRQWRMWLLCLAVALCVAAPQLQCYVTHDWYGPLLSHPASRLLSLQPQDVTSGSDVHAVAGLLYHQVERSILSFQYYPDTDYLAAFKSPLLTLGEAVFFLIGFAYCVARWRSPLAAFLLGWFVVGLLGSILTRYPPKAHHMIGIVSVPAAFGAIAIDLVRRRVARSLVSRAPAGALVAVALMSLVAAQAIHEYFVHDARFWPVLEITEVARVMRALAPTHDLVLVGVPVHWEEHPTFRFITHGVEAVDKLPTPGPMPPSLRRTDRDVAFIVCDPQPAVLRALRTRYAHGILDQRYGPAGQRLVATYEISRSEVNSR